MGPLALAAGAECRPRIASRDALADLRGCCEAVPVSLPSRFSPGPLVPRYSRFLEAHAHRRSFNIDELVEAGFEDGGYVALDAVDALVHDLDARGVEVHGFEDVPPVSLPDDATSSYEAYTRRLQAAPLITHRDEIRIAFGLELAEQRLRSLLFSTPAGRNTAASYIAQARRVEEDRPFIFHWPEDIDWSSAEVVQALAQLDETLQASSVSAERIRAQWAGSDEAGPIRYRALHAAHIASDVPALLASRLGPWYIDQIALGVFDVEKSGALERSTPDWAPGLDGVSTCAALPELKTRLAQRDGALRKLIRGSLAIAAHILAEMRPASVAPSALAEAVVFVGFWKAARKYDARRGYRFGTYAVHWGRAAARRLNEKGM